VSRNAQVTAGQPESQAAEGVRSLEVRWILPGRFGSAVAGWLEQFPGEVEIREDVYLLDPNLRGLSVKVRGGRALDVKAYQGSHGVLKVAGHALGRMESWQKWSFPCDRLGREDADPVGWVPVRKRRRVSRFSLVGGKTGCAVELTEVRAREQDWWSLGLEATGPDDLRHSELEAAAAFLFARTPPDLTEFGLHASLSYAAWIRDALLGRARRRSARTGSGCSATADPASRSHRATAVSAARCPGGRAACTAPG
jgi:hypothetical protein